MNGPQDSLREKERVWELELMRLMEASTLTATATIAATTPNKCTDKSRFKKDFGSDQNLS